MVLDDRPRRTGDGGRVVVRPEHAGGDPGAIHEQEQLGRQGIGIGKAGVARQLGQALKHPALVRQRHLVPGMLELGEL